MIPPVAAGMALGVLLVILEGPTQRGLLLLLILVPFFYLGAEILARKIVVDANGIAISKLLRTTRLQWREIASLEAVRTGSKLFAILRAEDGRLALITNTIRPFKDLAANLLERVPEDRIGQGAQDLLSEPPSKLGPLAQAWIIALVLAGLVLGKVLGYS